MSQFRSFLRDHRRLAALLLAAALCMKALVPAGFMVEAHASAFHLTICGDGAHGGGAAVKAIRDKLPVAHGQNDHGAADHGKASQSCPYAVLGMASLGGADAPLLAMALAFVLALAFLPVAGTVAGRDLWLRPPLRGPPAIG